MSNSSARGTLPVLAVRRTVVFPGIPIPLIISRPDAVSAVRQAGKGQLFAALSMDGDVAQVGTVSDVAQVLELPDGNLRVVLSGKYRGRRTSEPTDGVVEIEQLKTPELSPDESKAISQELCRVLEAWAESSNAAPPDLLSSARRMEDPGVLCDMVCRVIPFEPKDALAVLEAVDVRERVEKIIALLQRESEFVAVENKLRARVRRERETRDDQKRVDETARQANDQEDSEIAELRVRIAEALLPDAVNARAEREFKRLSRMNPMSAEAAVVRNYLDWILALPWEASDEPAPDMDTAAGILETSHHGLDKVKDRILEDLAVAKRVANARGPILCLVGPPGVGKTSIARAIAKAMGRPFARVALGGVRDEAEIRGHRRTYIGSMPGRLVQALRRAESADPVILLDEVDKMTADVRGDPSSALLEVLDHEQNHAFVDHYLDLEIDLSKVTFVCTANDLRAIPLPLMDRLEVLEMRGYTESEKLTIAERFLIPRQRELAGLSEEQLRIEPDALRDMVRRYTRESGVRGLDRRIASVARKIARRMVEQEDESAAPVAVDQLADLLGPAKFTPRGKEDRGMVGLVKGLSVSGTGGALLDIEVAVVPGKGEIQLTGKLGDVLRESARAALTWVRTRQDQLGVPRDLHTAWDLHVHYPGNAGGVEGPSAGVAMVTGLVSALTGRPVSSEVAMTGEISLLGRVLPVGGIREKVLAAYRAGIPKVVLPVDNQGEASDLPEEVLSAVELHFVEHVDQVLELALG